MISFETWKRVIYGSYVRSYVPARSRVNKATYGPRAGRGSWCLGWNWDDYRWTAWVVMPFARVGLSRCNWPSAKCKQKQMAHSAQAHRAYLLICAKWTNFDRSALGDSVDSLNGDDDRHHRGKKFRERENRVPKASARDIRRRSANDALKKSANALSFIHSKAHDSSRVNGA